MSLYTQNRKWFRIFWVLFTFNLIAAVTEVHFGYVHIVKHEWLFLATSIAVCAFNLYTAKNMYVCLQRLKREEKRSIIDALSGKIV